MQLTVYLPHVILRMILVKVSKVQYIFKFGLSVLVSSYYSDMGYGIY